MKGLFSYDNKVMQALGVVADIALLNVIFILFCLPIFTIGAAQAGICTGMKVLLDKEDDSSCIAAFFRGFRNGFGKITLVWCFLTLMVCGMAYAFMTCYVAAGGAFNLLVIVCMIALFLCVIFQTLAPVFHSRFDCKPIHLISNVWFLLVAHPLRCIGSVLLIWLPVIILCLNLYTFLMLGPVFITLLYGIAYLFTVTFMKKPFKTLTDDFNERHGLSQTNTVDSDMDDEEEIDEDKSSETLLIQNTPTLEDSQEPSSV